MKRKRKRKLQQIERALGVHATVRLVYLAQLETGRDFREGVCTAAFERTIAALRKDPHNEERVIVDTVAETFREYRV